MKKPQASFILPQGLTFVFFLCQQPFIKQRREGAFFSGVLHSVKMHQIIVLGLLLPPAFSLKKAQCTSLEIKPQGWNTLIKVELCWRRFATTVLLCWGIGEGSEAATVQSLNGFYGNWSPTPRAKVVSPYSCLSQHHGPKNTHCAKNSLSNYLRSQQELYFENNTDVMASSHTTLLVLCKTLKIKERWHAS